MPYAVRSVAWDQGESGSGVDTVSQFDVMRTLVTAWRRNWGRTDADMPFLLVQKPSGGGWNWSPDRKGRDGRPSNPPKLPADPNAPGGRGSGYARESYQKLLDIPGTGMANAMDLGGGTHPPDKDRYGRRLADVALGMVYGRDVPWKTPRFDSMSVHGTKAVVKFKDVRTALALAPHAEKLTGFAVAGEDGTFAWAEARIIAPDAVEVWSDRVAHPAAVRYAWAGEPRWATLATADGLPVWAFRTDTWPAATNPEGER